MPGLGYKYLSGSGRTVGMQKQVCIQLLCRVWGSLVFGFGSALLAGAQYSVMLVVLTQTLEPAVAGMSCVADGLREP